MVTKATFAVCLIFWFELRARWLDWCQQIGSLSGGIPALGSGVFWVRGLAQLSAEVRALTGGGITNVRDIDFCVFQFSKDVCSSCLLSICHFPFDS